VSSAEGKLMCLPFCFRHREDINGSYLKIYEEEEEEEEEEEDTFIYQLWAHEGHEYSHI
jgi:predicted small secreted protein